MNYSDIESSVIRIVLKNTWESSAVDINAPLQSTQGINSMTLLNIVVDIEEFFSIRFDNADELDKIFTSIRTVCDYLWETLQ